MIGRYSMPNFLAPKSEKVYFAPWFQTKIQERTHTIFIIPRLARHVSAAFVSSFRFQKHFLTQSSCHPPTACCGVSTPPTGNLQLLFQLPLSIGRLSTCLKRFSTSLASLRYKRLETGFWETSHTRRSSFQKGRSDPREASAQCFGNLFVTSWFQSEFRQLLCRSSCCTAARPVATLAAAADLHRNYQHVSFDSKCHPNTLAVSYLRPFPCCLALLPPPSVRLC
jgi:hypothetical protein